MICQFCGLKTDSIGKCTHCSHDKPITLIYRSYSNASIIARLSSILDSPNPIDSEVNCDGIDSVDSTGETTANASINPILTQPKDSMPKVTDGLTGKIEDNDLKNHTSQMKGLLQKHGLKIAVCISFLAGLFIGITVDRMFEKNEESTEIDYQPITSNSVSSDEETEASISTTVTVGDSDAVNISTTVSSIAIEFSEFDEFTDDSQSFSYDNSYEMPFINTDEEEQTDFQTPTSNWNDGAVDGILRERGVWIIQ